MSGSLGMKVSEINAHKEYKILQEKLFKCVEMLLHIIFYDFNHFDVVSCRVGSE